MPKIIKDLKNRFLDEARRQIEENGYSSVTVRSVAEACGVGVGTLYNYFDSKDELLATYMLDDWNKCISDISAVSTYSESPAPVLRCIYDQLVKYAAEHNGVLRDKTAINAFGETFTRYHKLLREQLAVPLRRFCCDDFHAEFIAEAMLNWSMTGKEFHEIYDVLKKLFK